jgi:endonuclease YncB( thermonuclease family)
MICIFALCLTGAIAVDGDTLKLRDQRYRVWGIDAPERGAPGSDFAKATLARLTFGQTLVCEQLETDRYQRPVIRCYLPSGDDLACELVRLGAAEDWPKYSKGFYGGCR